MTLIISSGSSIKPVPVCVLLNPPFTSNNDSSTTLKGTVRLFAQQNMSISQHINYTYFLNRVGVLCGHCQNLLSAVCPRSYITQYRVIEMTRSIPMHLR